MPDDWFPHLGEQVATPEIVERWGPNAVTAFHSSPDRWGLLHRFRVGGTEGAATLIDEIDAVPGTDASRDDALAVGESMGERLRHLLAAASIHSLVATGRATRRSSLRKLWSIDGQVAGLPVELRASMATTDAVLDLTSWKFRGRRIDINGSIGGDALAGMLREDSGSFRAGTDHRVEWSPGGLEIDGTEMSYRHPNVRSPSLTVWVGATGRERDTRRGTLDVDTTVVAVGPDAEDQRLVALVGVLFLIRNGVAKRDTAG